MLAWVFWGLVIVAVIVSWHFIASRSGVDPRVQIARVGVLMAIFSTILLVRTALMDHTPPVKPCSHSTSVSR